MPAKLRSVTLGLLVFGGLLAAAFLTGLSKRCPLELLEARAPLPDLWDQMEGELALTLRNRGEAPLSITGFVADCNCVTLEPSRFTLAPGGEQRVRATLALRFPSTATAGTAPAQFRLVPLVEGWTRDQVPRWDLRGVLRRAFADLPDQLQLNSEPLSGVPGLASARLRRLVPLKEVAAHADHPGLRAEVEQKGEDLLLRVRHTEAAHGYLKSKVWLEGTTADGTRVRSPAVPVFGSAEHDVRLEPPQILVGWVPAGQEVETQVTVQAGPHWKLKNVVPELPAHLKLVEITSGDPADSNRRIVRLRLTAPAGAFTEEIKIRLEPENAGQRGRVLTALLLGHGGER